MGQLYFCENLDTDLLYIEGDECRHLVQVMRIQKGAQVHLIDGKGQLVIAEVIQNDKKSIQLKPIAREKVQKKWNFNLTLAFVPTKNNDRNEWLIEKIVEIGVDQILPIQSKHMELKFWKPDRIEKIIKSAVKQSQKVILPQLQPIQPFKAILPLNFDYKLIAHCNKGNQKFITETLPKTLEQNNILICIGPEGDFSENEISLATENQFIEIHLGDSRLRAETACVFTTSIIHSLAYR